MAQRWTNFAEAEAPAMKPILVLACGNSLRGDDGVGLRIGSALQADFHNEPGESALEVILTQQLLPEHAEPLSKADLAIFIDCSAIVQPGVVSTQTLSPAQTLPRIFTHHLDPSSLLKLTQDLFGRSPSRAVSITVGGKSFEMQEQLSEPVETAIPNAVEAVRHAYINAKQE
jgi:hydrogenase maturation protease